MSGQNKNMFTALFAPIVAKVSRLTTRRDIVLPTAKPARPSSVAAPTIIRQSAPFVVQTYQTASVNGRRATAHQPVKPQPVSVGSGAPVPPLNSRCAADVDAALKLTHELFNEEHKRQAELYRLRYGRMPFYSYEWAAVANDTYRAIAQAAALLRGGR